MSRGLLYMFANLCGFLLKRGLENPNYLKNDRLVCCQSIMSTRLYELKVADLLSSRLAWMKV